MLLEPGKLLGKVWVPPSKSIAHRAIIAAALSENPTIIRNIALSRDIVATLNCVKALGARYTLEGEVLRMEQGMERREFAILECDESGSTLRFFLSIAPLFADTVELHGSKRLLERPMSPIFSVFESCGVEYEWSDSKILVRGRLKAGSYAICGDVSSQFITGLLFALAKLEGDSVLNMTTPLQSRGYVDLTLDFLPNVSHEDYRVFHVKGGRMPKICDYSVEGDCSSAAFWVVANTLGNQIEVCGLNHNSKQGDRIINDIVATCPTEIDMGEIPDLLPILAVWACGRQGTVRLHNASRTRIKESDRLYAIATELTKLGAKIVQLDDELVVEGDGVLRGGRVDGWNDHRIAMSLAIASTICCNEVEIRGAECVDKSYPNFFTHWQNLKKPLT